MPCNDASQKPWLERYRDWLTENFGDRWYAANELACTSEDRVLAGAGQFMLDLAMKIFELENAIAQKS
jgi:hypothetical protein